MLDVADVFTALRIEPFDGTRPEVLSSPGEWIDDDHVLIPTESISTLPGAKADDPGWATSFAAMVAYATAAGWVDDRGWVRVHVGR